MELFHLETLNFLIKVSAHLAACHLGIGAISAKIFLLFNLLVATRFFFHQLFLPVLVGLLLAGILLIVAMRWRNDKRGLLLHSLANFF
jgi:hypothetical protein